jgi:hypothetical protein
MSISSLGRAAGRFLTERLELLKEALEGLGQRLREGVAQLLGAHVGQAVRDSVGAALANEPDDDVAARFDRYERYDHDGYDPDDIEEERFWGHAAPPPRELPPQPEGASRWSRCKALLTGGVQVASVWLQHRLPQKSLRWLVGLGSLAGLLTLASGPLVGGLVTAAVTGFLLARPANPTVNGVHCTAWASRSRVIPCDPAHLFSPPCPLAPARSAPEESVE